MSNTGAGEKPLPVEVMGDDEWVPEQVIGSRTRSKVKQYHVKWRGYAETTWEPCDWLFEEGYKPLVDAYNKRCGVTPQAVVDPYMTRQMEPFRQSRVDRENNPW
jgi:hypothetical protein